MEDKKTPKEIVLSVYPDAIFHRVQPSSLMGAIFSGAKSRLKLSGYLTEDNAWIDAAQALGGRGLITK